ncbi:glycosyltransferase [Paenibacillus sp. J5C_2022]|uniref:glycosyltransferase n=1 Tax=Paenibacillus sp. J5C2022 TaxID=2977129 RepID=UPI0021D1AAAA|nr:glycosyltransferase [Paenibacillus sp. J5C2022]MCU6710292.1 glycosyltransferase [Paenibacillus sp. J5C2022]
MKRLLFVMSHLHCGGAEKALISLLQTIDYTRYEVDLLLFKQEGMFLHQLPQQVNVLGAPDGYSYFDMPLMDALKACMAKGKVATAISRLQAGLVFKQERNAARREQRAWKYISHALPKLQKHYDAVIGYLEKNPVYFGIEKVSATKKLGFIHNDYEKLGMDPSLDQGHFGKLDYLITVSSACGEVLERLFPQYADKVKVMHNIISPSTVRMMSLRPTPALPDVQGWKIVSTGRLHPQKGFDLAIAACRRLVDSGCDVRWYIIGEGQERERLEAMISQYGLQERFVLLGLQENPYPLIRMADIYVQPSRFEGKPVAVDEAKILGKPIVVTNFSTAADSIASMKNGVIVEMSEEALASGIKELLLNETLQQSFTKELQQEELGTESEVEKLYELIS